MTPAEYKDFCESTYACPPGTDREEYLRLLLIEELGEVASLFSKAMRDGVRVRVACDCGNSVDGQYRHFCWGCEQKGEKVYGPDAVNRDQLLKELGDVMWCAAMLSRTPSVWPDIHPYDPASTVAIQSTFLTMIGRSGSLHQASELCVLHGFKPEEVALANVEKLKGRAERGTIHGAGDER